MNDKIRDNQVESDDSENSILAKASDLTFDFLTGTSIPAPVRRNAIKAFGQLCSAIVDIPVAYLEGKAAENRAETQARIKIISTGGDQIASQMSVNPEYSHAAVKKYGQKIIRERVNLDKICEVAAHQIQQNSTVSSTEKELPTESNTEPNESSEANTISDDWVNTFENEGSSKSTEEMQLLFGRILAGEIQQPKSFSIKTVKLIGELDNRVANLFRRLCSLCIALKPPQNPIIDARVLSIKGNAATNSLIEYGLSFGQLNILEEYGLIISDYNSYSDYRISIANENRQVALGFTYQNKVWGLLPTAPRSVDTALNLHGVLLSRAGKELLGIVEIETDEKYTSALKEYFNQLNLEMLEIQ